MGFSQHAQGKMGYSRDSQGPKGAEGGRGGGCMRGMAGEDGKYGKYGKYGKSGNGSTRVYSTLPGATRTSDSKPPHLSGWDLVIEKGSRALAKTKGASPGAKSQKDVVTASHTHQKQVVTVGGRRPNRWQFNLIPKKGRVRE